MYYQVLIETKEKVGKSQRNKQYFELDKTNLLEIEEDIIIPYIKKEDFQLDGYFLNASDITRVVVKQTDKTTKELAKYENDNMPTGVIMYVSPDDIVSYDKHTTDITKSVFTEANRKIAASSMTPKDTKPSEEAQEAQEARVKNKVFIVHGQDELAKTEVARFLERLGLEAIILHEQVSSGNTIIEKIEEFTNVDFGIILYTPCDKGSRNTEGEPLQMRARQNVVFEHGYLIAKLGRRNVSALVKGKVEIPNDISGVVYIPMDDHKAWNLVIAKELRNAGFGIDMNKFL